MLQEIKSDIRNFFTQLTKESYAKLGIPYRRGYLFYGRPGCGKSSCAFALASDFKMPLYIMRLSNKFLTDDILETLFLKVPQKSLIIIEDIDAAWASRDDESNCSITFSGLLNAIDDITANENSILICTTNKKEKLDDALIRPGRIDKIYEFKLPDEIQAENFFKRFFPNKQNLCNKFKDKFKEQLNTREYSMADLQGLFQRYQSNPNSILEHIHEYGKTKKSDISLDEHRENQPHSSDEVLERDYSNEVQKKIDYSLQKFLSPLIEYIETASILYFLWQISVAIFLYWGSSFTFFITEVIKAGFIVFATTSLKEKISVILKSSVK